MAINVQHGAPFLTVPGVNNVRDAGGHPIKASRARHVRKGYVYRAADPSYISAEGVKILKSLGITTIYDFRSFPEIEKLKRRGPLGVEVTEHGIVRFEIPVFANEDWSPEAQAQRHLSYAGSDEASCAAGYAKAYLEIFQAGAFGAYREILLHIRDRPDDPFLFHCSAGKDRTGVAAALILMLAGCDDKTICDDYALTEVGLASRMEFIIQHMMKQPGLEGDRVKAERAARAKAEYMAASLRLFRDTYGSAEEYVTKYCRITEEDIQLIKFNLSRDDS